MTLVEMDNWCVRAIRYLHASSNESQNVLRNMLDDAIKNKYGVIGKENASLINISPAFQEFPDVNIITPTTTTATTTSMVIETTIIKEDIKTGLESDSELELDLLKEDLMCIVCKGMGVGARNRLVECGDCHNLYHQECHDPTITDEEIESGGWICATCRGAATKSVKKSVSSPSVNVPTSHKCNQSPVQSKLYSDKEFPEPSTGKSSSSTKASSSGKSSAVLSNRILTPNINIISADKRLQTMKKKAAKLQEKRKLSR